MTRLYKLILFFNLIFLTLSAHAQFFAYGGKLGLNFPGFQDEKIASQRITTALSATGAYYFNRSIIIQTELGLERKGNKYTNQYWDDQGELVPDSTYDVRTNLDYLIIPLYLKAKIGRLKNFYIQAGGYYGYLLRSRFSGMRFGEMVSKENIIDGLDRNDYGILFGGGLETAIRRELGLMLDVKYNYGLNDLNMDPLVIGHSNPLKNRSFTMSIGLVYIVE
jgi:hypothetical protein